MKLKSAEKTSNATKKDYRFRFATPEHKIAGDQVQLKFLTKDETIGTLSKDDKLTMFSYVNGTLIKKNDLKLSYGDILSLSGDYFASIKSIGASENPDDARKLFLEGFNSLAESNPEVTNEIDKINKKTYSKNSSLNEYIQQLMFVFLLGKKYFDITNSNIDHFYPWSVSAYKTGHEMALEMAKKGYELRKQGNYEEGNNYLDLAYQMNAAACHYLSDSFSAGHLRELSLRKQLSDKFGVLGGILVNNMHNEDSKLGVNVKNKNGDYWTTYGDGSYEKSEDTRNREIQNQALQESADEIFNTYQNGNIPEKSKVDDYLPEVDNSNNNNYAHYQYAPMFKSINNKIYYRDPVNELNPTKADYKELGFFSALLLVIKLRLFPDRYAPSFTPANESLQKSVNTSKIMASTNCDRKLALETRKDVDKGVRTAPEQVATTQIAPRPSFTPVEDEEPELSSSGLRR